MKYVQRFVLGVGISVSALTMVPAAFAADMVTKAPVAPTQLPAVDGVNGKFDVFGGSASHDSFYGSKGSLSVPLGYQFGVQFDGIAASYRNAFLGGAGAHAFWRDPRVGLIGAYGDYAYLDKFGGAKAGHFGAEGAIYIGRATLEEIIGVEAGNTVSATVGSEILTIDIKTRFFDKVDLSYYVTDNVKLSIGHRYLGGKNLLALGAEWGFAAPGKNMGALFAEGRVGQSDATSVWAGLRFYFGKSDKSLIRRHREDDPVNGLGDAGSTFGGASGSTPVPPSTPLVCTPPAVPFEGSCRVPS